MKYEFGISFSWDDGCCSWNPKGFTAESIDEVLAKVKEIMYSDPDGYTAEDIYIEGYPVDNQEGKEDFEFFFETKYRKSNLDDESKEMFQELKDELTKECFKDE